MALFTSLTVHDDGIESTSQSQNLKFPIPVNLPSHPSAPSVELGVPSPSSHFYIGLCLAILSTLFIGTSFIFKKRALQRSVRDGVRAGDGGLQYLCDGLWWAGLILMGIGEGANFLAYAFAPAVVVTPLGGLSVLVSAVLSSKFLGERLNLLGKMGCFLCLIGSTMVVVNAPKEQTVDTLKELLRKFLDAGFLTYSIFILLLALLLIFVFGPKFGKTNPMIFVTISGSIGSLSVVACKGIAIGVKEGLTHGVLLVARNWFFWFLLVGLIVNISIQMHYLNRALDIFNTSVITPILYVVFTGFVLIASAILFREWSTLSPTNYVGIILGLLVIVIGILMMTVLKDADISWRSLNISVTHKNTPTSGPNGSTWPNGHCTRATRGRFRQLDKCEDTTYTDSEMKPFNEEEVESDLEDRESNKSMKWTGCHESDHLDQLSNQSYLQHQILLRSVGQKSF